MSEISGKTSSEGGHSVQKKKSYSRQRHRKSFSNLEEKTKMTKINKSLSSNTSDKSSSKKSSTQSSDSKLNGELKKKQVNQENNDNNKPEEKKVNEKKDNEKKKKNRYNKKKSVADLKKEEPKEEKTVEKAEIKKSPSKPYLNQKKQRKSKLNLKAQEKAKSEHEEQDNSENDDIKLIGSFLTTLSLKRDEMEKESIEETYQSTNKYNNRKPAYTYTNKATKPKKEIPEYSDEEILKVLDCYDFPTSYKTHNLIEIFKEFEGNFRINWINDSRALFIFNTIENANAAYLSRIYETKFKIRPYENPPKTTQTYKINNEEKPFRKQRPPTSVTLLSSGIAKNSYLKM